MKGKAIILLGLFIVILALPVLTACGRESRWSDLELKVIKIQANLDVVKSKSNDLRSFIASVNPNYYSPDNEKELADISNTLDNYLFDLNNQIDELKHSIEYEANH